MYNNVKKLTALIMYCCTDFISKQEEVAYPVFILPISIMTKLIMQNQQQYVCQYVIKWTHLWVHIVINGIDNYIE